MEMLDDIYNAAAIVCGHVANEGCPIRLAIRWKPEDPDDSGWQFLCNTGKDEDPKDAQIWSVGEVLMFAPTLKRYVTQPYDIRLVWDDNNKNDWIEVKED